MDSNKFQFIDDANNFLGNVTGYADKAFGNLQGASQSAVDVATIIINVFKHLPKTTSYKRVTSLIYRAISYYKEI